MKQKFWLHFRNLSLIACVGVVLTLLAQHFVLQSEAKAIQQRLTDDTRLLENQFRQLMLNYSFATEWTARNLAADETLRQQQLDEESTSLFLYYPSLQRLLLLDSNFTPVYNRSNSQQMPLLDAAFADTLIASKLQHRSESAHALSAPAQQFSAAGEDIVIAAHLAPADGDNASRYLVLVVDISRLFDALVRTEIIEGYQVEITAEQQSIYRFAGSDAMRSDWAIDRPLRFASNEWQLSLWPTAERLKDMHSASGQLVLFGGLALTLGALFLGWRAANLRQRLLQQQQQIKQSRKQLKQHNASEAKLMFLADHDPQTELPNRNGLIAHLREQLPNCQTRHHDMLIMVIAIDSFRELNHALGHAVADEMMKRLALRIKKILPQRTHLARTGIDTFVLAYEVTSSQHNEQAIIQQLTESIRPQLFIDQQEIYCSASFGIAYASDADYDAETLLHYADTALFHAKQQGYFGVASYRPEQALELSTRRETLALLRIALEQRDLILYYQPIVNVRTHRAVGVEALLRWRHGEQLVEPLQFLDLMEQTGLVFSMTEFVIKHACKQAAEWRQLGDGKLLTTVNLSLRQLTIPELPELIAHHLKRSSLPADALQVELSEEVYLQLCNNHRSSVEQFKKLGLRVAVQLTGMTSALITAIKVCPPYTIKIAPSLIRDVPVQTIATELVEGILRTARNLRIEVVAVAVEQQPQIDFLLQRDCYMAQGNYLLPALPAALLSEKLSQPIKGHIERPTAL
ncbi:putative bifunctional diguanylate cyclase/phosphodiesterase [Pseudidiomarina salilacus]|uniref:putative bifunctional diguanylate cyclase/phosphodiesterase n=1 Tax=Pseudidiomarina salilacus TaxID=3384452 RepID=UPI00398558E6